MAEPKPFTPTKGAGLDGVPRNRSLLRAIDLLHALSESDEPLTIAAVTRRVDMPRATVNRILATLADAGFVERVDGGERWTLGYELVRLARLANPYQHLTVLAEPVLRALAQATGESTMLGVPLSRIQAEVILQVDGPQLVGASDWVGRSFALYASAFGKLMLAELDDGEVLRVLKLDPPRRLASRTRVEPSEILQELRAVRSQGYAESVDELEDGLSGVAVALRDPNGRLTAMLGVGGPSFRMTGARLADSRKRLGDIARKLQRRLTLS